MTFLPLIPKGKVIENLHSLQGLGQMQIFKITVYRQTLSVYLF